MENKFSIAEILESVDLLISDSKFSGRVKNKIRSNYKRSITLIKEHQNESFYFFIDPIIELSEHYKKNNYERDSIILPVDTHNNRFSNNILANLVKEKLKELESK